MKNFMTKGMIAVAIILLSFTAVQAQRTLAGIIGTQTLDRDTTYFLDGFVFVNTGATLTIESGTVIKGRATPTNGDNSSALIIARGATIIADGTPTQPIIFTAEIDDVTNPTDLTQLQSSLWGGLLVLGNARLNSPGPAGPGGFIETQIEGIPEGRSALARYGGNNDADNSGIIRYVSIRHGGAILRPNEEINGLTLGGVGSGTTIDFVEIYANSDDGIEWFGGTVNVKHAVVAFVGDDSFDSDQGARVNGQFWFSIGDNASASNRSGEQDGATSPEGATPFSILNVSNATYIGKGQLQQVSGRSFFSVITRVVATVTPSFANQTKVFA